MANSDLLLLLLGRRSFNIEATNATPATSLLQEMLGDGVAPVAAFYDIGCQRRLL
jgi:hypothetical protein